MPLQLVNPEHPPRRRYPIISPSRSSSSSSYEVVPPENPEIFPADRSSLRSFHSSSEHTAVSDHLKSPGRDDEKLQKYLDDVASVIQCKTLPALPGPGYRNNNYRRHGEQHSRSSDEYDPHAVQHTRPLSYASSSTATNIHPLTASTQLASALGPDNVPYTTEIDTIPCAGVRIPNGPLTGLLAWRLVVRIPPPTKTKRSWWCSGDTTSGRKRSSYALDLSLPPAPAMNFHSYSDSPLPMMRQMNNWASISTASLPLGRVAAGHMLSYPDVHPNLNDMPPARPRSMMLSRQPHVDTSAAATRHNHHRDMSTPQPSALRTGALKNEGVAANFILDTSLPYSIVSRDTLEALGYSPSHFPAAHVDPHSQAYDDGEDSKNSDSVVTLLIQNIPTRLRIARPGEASRLGVQFLRDAGVSVFFPRDGDGVGPVLYCESARLLRDVPLTIPNLPNGGRGAGTKLTLPQRVRALFGLP
ncbi:hypothetical protein BDZ97DRAFT_958968 [Flammula alnicola]|nr:hypothetical protein BDZ97DRAFT_958968 [Flammula alnicola]